MHVSYRSLSLSSAYKHHEDAKKREYGQRAREVEHGVFTPLVLTSTGGMDREASTIDLLIYFVLTGTILSHTFQPFIGFDVVCPLPC